MSEPIVQTLTLAGAPLPRLNVRELRANLRAARAEVRTTRRPLIIAERGTRPALSCSMTRLGAPWRPPQERARTLRPRRRPRGQTPTRPDPRSGVARTGPYTAGPPACPPIPALSARARAGGRPARTGVTAAACQPAALSRRAGLGTLQALGHTPTQKA